MRQNKGMTLIEILVALAIFTISFLVLIDAQNLNIRNSAHARRMTLATILAQDKLTETLLKYKNKLTEIGEKEEGSFEGEYSKYRWEITSRDFAYDLSFLAMMAGENQEEKTEGSPLSEYLPKVSQFIKNSSKEITATVFWKEGAGERNISITTHLFNYKAPLPL